MPEHRRRRRLVAGRGNDHLHLRAFAKPGRQLATGNGHGNDRGSVGDERCGLQQPERKKPARDNATLAYKPITLDMSETLITASDGSVDNSIERRSEAFN